MFTDEEIAEARERVRKELEEQGLEFAITDPAVLAPLARALNKGLEQGSALRSHAPATIAV